MPENNGGCFGIIFLLGRIVGRSIRYKRLEIMGKLLGIIVILKPTCAVIFIF